MRRVWPGGSRHSDGATRAENTHFLSHRPALIGILFILFGPGVSEGGDWSRLVGNIKLFGLCMVIWHSASS